MANYDISLVTKLREATGAGVVDCKKVLDEAAGDFEKALVLVKERGLQKVENRQARETGAGIISSYVHNGRIGALVDVRAETDFVVRSEPFQQLAKELAMQLAVTPAENVDAFLAQPYMRDAGRSVSDMVKEVIAKVGENVKIHAIARLEI